MVFTRDKLEFNGYLHSLRYICDKQGVDLFAIDNECDLNRVQKLYRSKLEGSCYILSLLWSNDFEKDFKKLKQKIKNLSNRQQALVENKYTLTELLDRARIDFCGIGTKRVKMMLNKLSEYDINAKIARILLEIEDLSITAKNSYGDFAKYKYYEKEKLIEELIEICKFNNIDYGFKDSDIPSMKSIVFFDLYGKQVSWHTNFCIEPRVEYKKDWDKLLNSNLGKIEEIILNNYRLEIKK